MGYFHGVTFRTLPTISQAILCRRWYSFAVNGSIKNYYNVLDVDPKADDKEIKSAFYAQSKKLHPDVTPDDDKAPDKFNELVEAYEVLSDSKKREAYDDILSKKNRRATFHSQPQDIPSDTSRRPQYGVDPRIMRKIEVDLSEERMRKAWVLYKERWAREESRLNELANEKKIFRMELDKKRSIYDKLSVEEKEILKENMRLFKHPKFMKKEQSDATTKKEFTSEKNHSDQKTSHKSRYKVNYSDDPRPLHTIHDDPFFDDVKGWRFSEASDPIFDDKKNTTKTEPDKQRLEELMNDMRKKSKNIKEHMKSMKSSSDDGIEPTLNQELRKSITGEKGLWLIVIFIFGCALFERNYDWSTKSKYVYLQENRKKHDDSNS